MIRHDWTLAEVRGIHDLPLLELVHIGVEFGHVGFEFGADDRHVPQPGGDPHRPPVMHPVGGVIEVTHRAGREVERTLRALPP